MLAGASGHDDPLEVGGQRGHDGRHVPLQPRHHQGGQAHFLSPSLRQLASDPANKRQISMTVLIVRVAALVIRPDVAGAVLQTPS